jgi:long-subunit acyl-CoA synthetase (AMP-forming)
LFEAIAVHAGRAASSVALQGADETITYGELPRRIERVAEALGALNARAVGLLADNGPAWALVDLAALRSGITLVPLPAFFSDAQLAHAVHDAGIGAVLTDVPERFQNHNEFCFGAEPDSARLASLAVLKTQKGFSPRQDLTGIAKVTYTSGSTGEPKGVLLRKASMERVAHALQERVGREALERHLALLPLSTLLENIAGLYLPLLAGTSTTLWPQAALGMRGASGLNSAAFGQTLAALRPTSLVMIPEMLKRLVDAAERGTDFSSLKFVAVGGAQVALDLLQRAQRVGLPVYQGYGLSECASVVTLNGSRGNRPGSVGTALAHATLSVAPDGEVLVRGALFDGYLGGARIAPDDFFPTGDIGRLDADGYLHLTGRKKNIFITAYGRNVSPEWVEAELTGAPAIAQAAVFGEAQAANVAVIVPMPGATSREVAHAVEAVNRQLPDYARVAHVVLATAPFSVANGQLTGTQRLRRAAVWSAYRTTIEAKLSSTIDLEESAA